jgi:CRISPR-associated protein Cas1
VLYVMEAGRRVMTNGKAFLVAEADTVHLALPASRLGRIEIGPRADIEPEALRLAAAQQIEVALVDGHGRTQCTLQPAGPGRAPRQLAQASAILDSARRTGIARRIVHARVHNQRALLSRLNRRRKDPAIDEAFEMMGRVRRKLDSADSVAALMGHEGEAAAGYWPALGRTLMHGFTFDRRRRHPANDPLNLMLNVLSSFLLRDMSALIGRHGLHSGFAFLHQADDREASLVFDLVEGFRAPLVEGLAVYLVNNRILKTDDFAVWDDEVCRIDADGMKALIRGWEDWLARLVVDPRGGDKVHWRRLMELDVEALAADLDGGPAFAPYLMDY